MLAKLLKPTIEEAIRNKDFRALKDGLLGIPAQDLAEMLAELEEPSRSIIFRLLPRQLMTEVFEFLPIEVQEELLTTLGTETTKHLLENMSPDDRTHLLEELPGELVKRLMTLLSPEERRVATSLLVFPEDSVGRMMTPEYIELKPDMTAEEALQHIRNIGLDKETIYSSYVTDEEGHLIGRISLRSLVLAPPDKKVKDLLDKHFIRVNPRTDREEAIHLCQKYDLLALPVVDDENKLLGIVTIDDIMDVKDEEVTEDIHKMAAVLPTEEAYLKVSSIKMVWRRVIWLFILLVTETVTGKVIKNYEGFITRNTWLPIFIPILIATGGNTGSQAAMMVIRALALGELSVSDFFKALLKQVYTGVLLALVLCPLMFMIALVLQSDPIHSVIVAVALTFIVTAANVVGTVLPLFFKAMRLDPALMSGPFISTIMDIIGIFIYFHIAFYLEHLL
ncbi:magnesium transporter [Candidatus Sumerlaeota bacterium]|nr:magnesium transporter [Candidatus Sumerlaeota bacterium]